MDFPNCTLFCVGLRSDLYGNSSFGSHELADAFGTSFIQAKEVIQSPDLHFFRENIDKKRKK